MIRIEGNVLLDEKSYENILIYSISYKTLIGAKPLYVILFLKNMMSFMIGLDVVELGSSGTHVFFS